eukprot:EG_transcript_25504
MFSPKKLAGKRQLADAKTFMISSFSMESQTSWNSGQHSFHPTKQTQFEPFGQKRQLWKSPSSHPLLGDSAFCLFKSTATDVANKKERPDAIAVQPVEIGTEVAAVSWCDVV